MICPKCENKMEAVSYENHQVYKCTGCKGIWFDKRKHQVLKKLKGSEVIDDGSTELGKKYNKIDHIKCPECHSPMIRMVDAEQPHIWYEECAVCDGVFFDAGEFKDFKEHTLSDFFKDITAGERK